MQVRKQHLELDIEQWTGSKLGKGYIKAVYCQPAYLTYMQSTTCKTSGWMKNNLELLGNSRIARTNINNLRYADEATLMAECEEEPKGLLMKVKEENEKAGLKLNIQKTKIMTSGTITSWEIDEETMETVRDFIFLSSNITVDGDIKRYLLLGSQLWQT